MKTIGFVGAGIMGRGMARSLIRNGHALRIYNRTRAKAEEVAESGGTVAATPAEAADGADMVFTMLADPAAVMACFDGPDGIVSKLRSGAVVVDSSTISAPANQEIAELVKAKGAHLLDAPVFGSKNEAETGTLGFLVGGDRAVFESVQDVLSCLGKTTYIGESGKGVYAKLVVNLIISGALEAFNEGMVLATKAGLDPELMYSVIMSCRARCGIFEMKGPQVLKRDFTPFFPLKLMAKDIRLVIETAEALGLELPTMKTVRDVYAKCIDAGLAEEDFSASIKHLEQIAKVEVGHKPQ